MKALTIRQPWASLIALGVKTIETRSWRASQSLIGQTIAIHAGKWQPEPGNEYGTGWWWHDDCGDPIIVEQNPTNGLPMVEMNGDDERDGTCVVLNGTKAHIDHEGEFRLTDIADQLPFGDFQPGRWAWMLTDVQPCDPVPAKGKQGLWNWDGA